MTRHEFPGLGTQPLSNYLAALGVARIIARQADPQLRFGWQGEVFRLNTTVDDLTEFLLHHYIPTPVVSPWNGGSGFGEKDKASKQILGRIRSSESARLRGLAATISASEGVLGEADAGSWAKGELLQRLRNVWPDEAIDWLDAAVVLTGDIKSPSFPPLLGTGGNDGRLEFSSNFHQRLADVLPELGAKQAESAGWLRDALQGTNTTPLTAATPGQFNAVSAGGPNALAMGTNSLTNPWIFVLMMEGALWFATSSTRRHGSGTAHAAIPFTVAPALTGRATAAGDESRGELWAPVVDDVSAQHFTQIMREARASWNGRSASNALQMQAAARSFGVDRGISRFRPHTIAQRNGLAFAAIARDPVWVKENERAQWIRRPLERGQYFVRLAPGAQQGLVRRFERACETFLAGPSTEAFLEVLELLNVLEQAVLRSVGGYESASHPPRRPTARELEDFLTVVLDESPEARIAAAISSARYQPADQGSSHGKNPPPLREVLQYVPSSEHGPTEPPVRGLGTSPLVQVLGEATVWLANHTSSAGVVGTGFRPVKKSLYTTSAGDAHHFALGYLDDALVERYLMAFLAIDWDKGLKRSANSLPLSYVDPGLAMLHAYGSPTLCMADTPLSATASLDQRGSDGWKQPVQPEFVVGYRPEWALPLRSGRAEQTLNLIAQDLRRRRVAAHGELQVIIPLHRGFGLTPDSGQRYAACMLLPGSTSGLRRIGALPLAETPSITEGDQS